MLRSLWAAIVALAVTIPVSAAVMLVAAFSTSAGLIDRLIRFWARSLLWGAGIKVETERMEIIDPQQRYILVANHYSYFDIPILLSSVSQPIRFMAKISLFKIPLFGWAIG